jgi:hypothetical protein
LASLILTPFSDRLSRTFFVMATVVGMSYFGLRAARGPARVVSSITVLVLAGSAIYMVAHVPGTAPVGFVIFATMFAISFAIGRNEPKGE